MERQWIRALGALLWLSSACANNYAGDEDTATSCVTDADCTTTEHCEDGLCASECVNNDGCPAGSECVRGACIPGTVCSSSNDCAEGEHCAAGVCRPSCATHNDCTTGQHCADGTCAPGTPCASDENCPSGEVCVSGVCVAGCRDDADCTDGRVCVSGACADCTDDGQCADGLVCRDGNCQVECQENGDCANGQVCRDGSCESCASDGECGAGKACVDGACQDIPSCSADSDCAANAHCADGRCVDNPSCSVNTDCPATQACVNGTCTRNNTCDDNGDCTPQQTCVNGVCTFNPTCSSAEDCAPNQGCQGGYCVANPSCDDNADCPATQSCVSGTCTRNGGCTDNSDCALSQTCVAGVCHNNPACTVDADCPSDKSCVSGVCSRNPPCAFDADCSASESCVDGVCRRNPSCTEDSQCPAAQSCVNGVCTDNGACQDHGDCPASQFCQGGVCTQGPQCTSDTQCTTSERCVAGRCEPNPACSTDAECPREQHCEAGTCARNDTCTTSADCPLDQACLSGVCVQVQDCRDDLGCQDGTLCNGFELCDVLAGGICLPGVAPLVDDQVGCTDDVCDPATGTVTHNPVSARCDDGNVCSLDTCDVILDCIHDADPTAVPAQLGGGDCHKEVCQGLAVVSAVDDADLPTDDGFACATETCTAGVPGVTTDHDVCQDQNACNGAERCVVGQGCVGPASPFECPAVDACHVGFCDPATGCGSRPLDADSDGHFPVTCGGDDCDDNDATSYTGHAEVAADGRDNDCNGFTDEGFGSLACPAPPVGKRILDTITLTATVSGAVPGTYSVLWSVEAEPSANSLALQGATTTTVTFSPVVRGDYTLRVRLTQVGASEQNCTVSFTVAGPDEDFNAQLVMFDAVDVDLHVLHPIAEVNAQDYFFSFNWGPANSNSCFNAYSQVYSCYDAEDARALPDCHYGNCNACTVTVPGQPTCVQDTLTWNQDVNISGVTTQGQSWSTSFPFTNGGTFSADANPKLDIDNRRGCYQDAQGNTVCTPENVSIKRPANFPADHYTVAVHYYGEPVVQTADGFTGNVRGVAPAGKQSVDVEVEVYCKGVGFKRYRCEDIPVDGWCFVADAVWSGTQCSAVQGATRTFSNPIKSTNSGLQFDVTKANVIATPIP
ncbi:MAG: hypothetical protein AB2A00_26910 [Myxococcota bacterium]